MLEYLQQMKRHWRWGYRQWRRHPDLVGASTSVESLRLVLGTARSGTSWIVETMAASSTPLRYWHEPFFRYHPRMHFSEGEDHLAIRYEKRLSRWHPLVQAYRSLTVEDYDWGKLGLNEKDLRRNDTSWSVCMVKEVHSLLATEGLLKHLEVPALLVVRDPVYVCDSLFHRDGLDSHYARAEAREVMTGAFLRRFLPNREESLRRVADRLTALSDPRRRVVFRRILTIGLLHAMLRTLADERETTMLVRYERLCKHPEEVFSAATEFLGIAWDARAQRFLRDTMQRRDEAYDPHSVYRNTKKQVQRTFKFLDDEEAEAGYRMLEEAGLRIPEYDGTSAVEP